MRKQYHFWPSDDGLQAWDVDRLIALSANFPVKRVALSDVWEVDTVYWFDDADERPTVRNVILHAKLIDEASLAYPVIRRRLGADGRVMDGMHRIAKAILAGDTHIDARQFESDPPPDHVSANDPTNCRTTEASARSARAKPSARPKAAQASARSARANNATAATRRRAAPAGQGRRPKA